jgi:hypothetical protein
MIFVVVLLNLWPPRGGGGEKKYEVGFTKPGSKTWPPEQEVGNWFSNALVRRSDQDIVSCGTWLGVAVTDRPDVRGTQDITRNDEMLSLSCRPTKSFHD